MPPVKHFIFGVLVLMGPSQASDRYRSRVVVGGEHVWLIGRYAIHAAKHSTIAQHVANTQLFNS